MVQIHATLAHTMQITSVFRTNKQTNKQANKQTNKQTNKQANKQASKQTNKKQTGDSQGVFWKWWHHLNKDSLDMVKFNTLVTYNS